MTVAQPMTIDHVRLRQSMFIAVCVLSRRVRYRSWDGGSCVGHGANGRLFEAAAVSSTGENRPTQAVDLVLQNRRLRG